MRTRSSLLALFRLFPLAMLAACGPRDLTKPGDSGKVPKAMTMSTHGFGTGGHRVG